MSDETAEKVDNPLVDLLNIITGMTTVAEPEPDPAAAAKPLGALRKALINEGFDHDQAYGIVFEILRGSQIK